ncbi:AAA family ATPase [Yersinia intermedia]|uniref:AAA family ATPase n=1 Tax=Yersinia intermedia TaxID=631 RepID=UPI0005DE3997|nr:AAA family ATPase [Yersinia intermedia]CNE42740.1 Uncharacterized conserved protein [Yersinia intermedia]
MINSIGVRNLRSFRKKTTIDIKPLTIFVGRNSSGKSSLIRTFPLLRQSLEANTMGPILWFGRFVDFGTFAEAVSSVDSTSGSTKPSEIEFSFGITTSDFDFYFYSSTESLDAINLELNLLVTSQDQKTIAKEHEVIIDKTSIRIIPNTDEKTTAKLIIENNTIKYEIAEIFINNRQKFLPHIIGKKVELDRNIMKKRRVSLNRNNEWIIAEEYNHSGMAKSRDSLRNEISGLVINELQAFFNKSSSLDRIIEKLIPISSVTREDLLQELKNAFRDKKHL